MWEPRSALETAAQQKASVALATAGLGCGDGLQMDQEEAPVIRSAWRGRGHPLLVHRVTPKRGPCPVTASSTEEFVTTFPFLPGALCPCGVFGKGALVCQP